MRICNPLGSPPLAREGQINSAFNLAVSRITPARAGRTAVVVLFQATAQDHPRSRGKDLKKPSKASKWLGITPARAGRTWKGSGVWWRPQDHPRSRGKDGEQRRETLDALGSPPLAREGLNKILDDGLTIEDHPRSRGKDGISASILPMSFRITPARAGRTCR